MPPDAEMTFGEIGRSLGRIETDISAIKTKYSDEVKDLHIRCNTFEHCLSSEIKPMMATSANDIAWIKKFFWTMVGIGLSSIFMAASSLFLSFVVNGG